MMRGVMAWTYLLVIFLIAGKGFNMFRVHIELYLAYGHLIDAIWMWIGIFIGLFGTAFLGGFVYYRDKKRGKLKREGWRARPVQKTKRQARNDSEA